jgi:hypothetical protein
MCLHFFLSLADFSCAPPFPKRTLPLSSIFFHPFLAGNRSEPLVELAAMVEETESKRETSFLLRTIEELHAGEDGLENLGKLVGSVISAPRVNFSLSLFLMFL